MLSTTDDQSQTPGQTSTSPQESRTDFQQTNPNAQQKTAPVSQSPSVSQQQLTSDQLKVGQTTVKNQTSTPSNYIISHNYLNAAWLWLIVPIVLAYFLFKPERKKSVMSASDGVTAVPEAQTSVESEASEPVESSAAAADTAAPAQTKKKSSKKKK